MKVFNKLILLFCLFCLFSSCSQNEISPPYVITQSSVRVGKNEPSYSIAGAHVFISNVSNKTIHSLTLSFLLFDSDGDLCLPLGKCIESECLQKIKPFQTKEIVLSLDSALGGHIHSSYQLGNVFVKRVAFSDGSVWNDPFGLYAE